MVQDFLGCCLQLKVIVLSENNESRGENYKITKLENFKPKSTIAREGICKL